MTTVCGVVFRFQLRIFLLGLLLTFLCPERIGAELPLTPRKRQAGPAAAIARATSLERKIQTLRTESVQDHVHHRHNGGHLKGIQEAQDSFVRIVYEDRFDIELSAMKAALVMFGDPTSSISRKYNTALTQAAQRLKKAGISVVKIDIGHHHNLNIASRYNITIVPSFKYFVRYQFRQNKARPEEQLRPYIGRRTSEDFAHFMREQSSPSVNTHTNAGTSTHKTTRDSFPDAEAREQRRNRTKASKRAAAISSSHALARQLAMLKTKYTKLALESTQNNVSSLEWMPKLTKASLHFFC